MSSISFSRHNRIPINSVVDLLPIRKGLPYSFCLNLGKETKSQVGGGLLLCQTVY